jgi:uncharacterized protein (DUF924 family)
MPRRWYRSRYKNIEGVEQFTQDVENVRQGKYKDWENSKDGILALAVLCN